jgi:hypothetical protein
MLNFRLFSTLHRLPPRSPSTSSSSLMRLVLADPILCRGVHHARLGALGQVPPPSLVHHPQSKLPMFPAPTATRFGVEMRGCDGVDEARRAVLFHGSFLKAEESRHEEELEEAGGGGHGGAACPLVHLAGGSAVLQLSRTDSYKGEEGDAQGRRSSGEHGEWVSAHDTPFPDRVGGAAENGLPGWVVGTPLETIFPATVIFLTLFWVFQSPVGDTKSYATHREPIPVISYAGAFHRICN